MNEVEKSKAIEEILQLLITVIGRRTSQNFIFETTNNVLRKIQQKYDFFKYIKIEKTISFGQICKINVEDNPIIKQLNIKQISESLNEIIRMTFQLVIQDEIYYNIDLQEVTEEVRGKCKKLVEEFGIYLKFGITTKGSEGLIKGRRVGEISGEIDISYTKNSEVLKPVTNALMHLLEKGMLKKEKNKEDAVKTMVDSIRDLEKQHKVFKYMVFEDAGEKDEQYNIKTEFEVKDAFFFNYDDAYTVEAVSKIDEIPSSELSEALRDFILETGRYISIEYRPEFITKFKHLITKECLLKLEEIGINLEEINKTLKKEGYYLLIKETIQALFDMMTSKTSEKFTVIAIDAILEKLQEKHKEVLKHITVDKSQYEKGMKAIIINPEINNEDPYKIAKTIQGMLRVTQEKQQNYPDKVTFIQDFEREIGERCSAELKKIGVNLHLISLRYM